MSANAEFVRHVRDQLAPLGALTGGTFFGGHAIKSGGRQFAMVMGNTLYFRVNDTTRADYEAAGSAPFAYTTKKGVVQVRTYFRAPEALLDDRDLLVAWAHRAVAAAAPR